LKIFALTMKVCIDRDFAIITGLIGGALDAGQSQALTVNTPAVLLAQDGIALRIFPDEN
jgi:hypothetical protein